MAPLHRTFPFGARSLDTRYCYSPSAAEVPDDDVVVDADTGVVAAAVVAVAAAVDCCCGYADDEAPDVDGGAIDILDIAAVGGDGTEEAENESLVAAVQVRLAVVDTVVPVLLPHRS